MKRTLNLYLVYDVLAQDVITFMPCPSDNAAILGFANAKASFEEKGYNPRLVELYRLGAVTLDSLKCGLDIQPTFLSHGLLCNLANAPLEVERITNELVERDVVDIDELED